MSKLLFGAGYLIIAIVSLFSESENSFHLALSSLVIANIWLALGMPNG